jgi:simple sugar transport system permease protein
MSSAHSSKGPALSPIAWLILGLLVLALVNISSSTGFLRISWQDGHWFGTPVDILRQGSRTMLLALGMTLVIATGGVDLSVGSVVAISGAVGALLLQHGSGWEVTLLAAGGVGLLAGAINGLLVTRFGLQPIVATLILMVAGRGVAQLVTGGQVLIIKDAGFEFLANGFVAGLPLAPLWVAGLFLVANVFLRRTAAGLFFEAVGDNETASRFAGLAASRVKICAYVVCAVCAGLAGVLVAANIGAADGNRAGENAELDAIFAVVVGGTALSGGRFTLLGSFLGALLIQTLTTTMYNLGVAPAVAPVPKALVIVAVSLLQSERFRARVGRLWRREESGP